MDLMCCERLQTDNRKAEIDPLVFSDQRVFENLISLEKRSMTTCNYFEEVQKDIKPFMRKVTTTWMLEVCEEVGAEEQVFPLAVTLLDRFLCRSCIMRKHLQLAAAVCIMLASKIKQCQYITIDTLCYYTEHSITPNEMMNWELLILSKLGWDVSGITGFDYIDQILNRIQWKHESSVLRRHACVFVGICYTDPRMIQTPPSAIASASICAAIRGLNLTSPTDALETVCKLTRVNTSVVERIADMIEQTLVAEAPSLQTTVSVTKMVAPHHVVTYNNNSKQNTIDGYPETPTDVQEIHF